MAISNISQFSTAINTSVPAGSTISVGSGLSSSYVYGSVAEQGAEMAVSQYGTANAFRVVEGGLGADGVASTATEVLEFQPVVNGAGEVTSANIVKMPAATTQAGNVKAGALSGRVPAGTVLGGIAIGAGIGLKEAATHRQFWEDLVTIGDGINTPEQTIQVIWRMLEDGSIQSYCDKRSVDKFIENLYRMEAFNVIDHLDNTYSGTGPQYIQLGALDPGYASLALAKVGGASPYVGQIYMAGLRRYEGATIASVHAEWNLSQGGGSLFIDYYNMSDDSYREVTYSAGEGYTIQIPAANRMGRASANINVDGTITQIVYQDGTTSAGSVLGMGELYELPGVVARVACSNAGAIFIPKNPNIEYNGTDILPPVDPSDFWTVFTDWLANSFTQPGYNPLNNSIVPTTWIPFTMPNINWQTDPAVGTQPDAWTGIYDFPDIFTNPALDPDPVPYVDPWIWKTIGDPVVPHIDIPYPEPTPYDDSPTIDPVKPSPTGSSPAIVAPSGDLSDALYTVYNPTQAEINSLGSYLWTQNIIELIAQFFQNPLDAIISLHKVYCTPTTGSPKNIKLGYLDSGVSANVVTSQYATIACGDVNVPELYHNALDYDNVSIQIFLPFIGFRELNAKECVGGKLRCTYTIDVYTGICLASIYVIKPGTSQLLYTFEGNCAIDIPLTSADRSRLVSGLITAGVSAVTGNPAGVVGGLASVHASIERSGSFSGNAGAMGVKKPYVIIKRAISAQPSNYAKLYGYPLNKLARLGSFKGFTRCESVHVDIAGATDNEKNIIEQMLKNGIII